MKGRKMSVRKPPADSFGLGIARGISSAQSAARGFAGFKKSLRAVSRLEQSTGRPSTKRVEEASIGKGSEGLPLSTGWPPGTPRTSTGTRVRPPGPSSMTMGVPFGTDMRVGGLYCKQKRAGGQERCDSVIRPFSLSETSGKCRLCQQTRSLTVSRVRKLRSHATVDETLSHSTLCIPHTKPSYQLRRWNDISITVDSAEDILMTPISSGIRIVSISWLICHSRRGEVICQQGSYFHTLPYIVGNKSHDVGSKLSG